MLQSGHTNNNRDRVTAATVTFMFHIVLLVLLFTVFLKTSNPDSQEVENNPVENEITFEEVVDFVVGGSYTAPVDIPDPHVEPELSAGSQTPAAPVPAPDPEVIQQQRREEIARRVKFATNNVEESAGDGGQNEVTTAQPLDVNAEVIGLEGFASEGFPRPQGFSLTGTIAISVTVDASGRIIASDFVPSKSNGRIKTDAKAINACKQAALQSKFSARPGTTTGGTGVIYYHFKQ